MKFDSKTVRKTINKAFLREPVERTVFNNFKELLQKLLDQIESAEKKLAEEEHCQDANIVALEQENERLVYELYGLSEEEIGIVEGGVRLLY